MQDLIPGDRYSMKNPHGIWEGEAEFVRISNTPYMPYVFKSLVLTRAKQSTVDFFKGATSKDGTFLLGEADWSFTVIGNLIEANE